MNLTDGLDGLAAGCLVMVSLVLALLVLLEPHRSRSLSEHPLHRGERGDRRLFLRAGWGVPRIFVVQRLSGASVHGRYRLARVGRHPRSGSPCSSAAKSCSLLAGGIFVAEALSVILQVLSYRYRNKKRVFLCAPLHHHFEYKGWPETKVVVRFWIISLLFVIMSAASLKFQ